jgi:hypothetical protein
MNTACMFDIEPEYSSGRPYDIHIRSLNMDDSYAESFFVSY